MADKNWLIRTKNNQILGPATKQKVIELIQKGSLTGEDEVTSGNGYWFWIKEKELLEKYVFGETVQCFNPISEAPDVLTAGGRNTVLEPFLPTQGVANSTTMAPSDPSGEDENVYPDSEDLEYPDIDSISSSIEEELEMELIKQGNEAVQLEEVHEDILEVESDDEDDFTRLDLRDLSSQIQEMNKNNEEDLNFPSYGEVTQDLSTHAIEVEEESKSLGIPKESPSLKMDNLSSQRAEKVDNGEKNQQKKNKNEKASKSIQSETKTIKENNKEKKKPRNDKYLFFILIATVLFIVVLFYYYSVVLNKPIPVVGISSAHAQTISTLGKKKPF